MATFRFCPDEGAQEFRIGCNQGRWNITFLHKTVLSVDVSDDRFQQVGALNETA
jgi:hypothetical protein